MTAAALSLACWYFHISRIADRLGMTWVRASWTSVDPVWKSALNCQNLVTWFPYIAIWWINPKARWSPVKTVVAAWESSCVIILKSRLNSTGHSACTSEVHDTFDRQTHVPNNQWQLMCSHVLQPWECCNLMMAPIRNITISIFVFWLKSFYAVEFGNKQYLIISILIVFHYKIIKSWYLWLRKSIFIQNC